MSQEYEGLKLQKSLEVTELLESRHISDEEIKMVIASAESSGNKLYQPGSDKYLGKLRTGNVTIYAEYSIAGEETYTVHNAYSHMTELKE